MFLGLFGDNLKMILSSGLELESLDTFDLGCDFGNFFAWGFDWGYV